MTSKVEQRRKKKVSMVEQEDSPMYSQQQKMEKNLKPKKRKRKISDSDDEPEAEILPKWKIWLVFGAIFFCFILLYPSIFSPIINSIFGKATTNSPPNPLLNDPRNRQNSKDSPPNLRRPPMHPGAASMRMPQAEQQSGGGRGIFTYMLPIYTIGVVGFLLYSLFKSKRKKNKKKLKNRMTSYLDEEFSEEDEEESDIDDNRTGGLGRGKLRSVQQRLQKTEAAMRMILEQLETIAETTKETTTTTSPNGANSEPPLTDEQIEEKLNPEQVKEVEKNLKELKILSDMCKLQRAQVENLEDDSEDEEEGDESSQEEDEEEILEKELIEMENEEEVEIMNPVDHIGNDSIKTIEENEEIMNMGGISTAEILENTVEPQIYNELNEKHNKKSKNIRRRLRREY